MGRGRWIGLLATALVAGWPAAAEAQPCPLPIPLCDQGGGGDPPPEPTPEPEPQPQPVPPPPPPPGPLTAVEGSATVGVDPGHTGYFPDAKLAPPLEPVWRHKFRYVEGAPAGSSPLYGQGRVYVSHAGMLEALDARNGRVLWTVRAQGTAGAYDAGRVFMIDGGTLRAHSAADGAALWTVKVNENYPLSGVPVATGGVVYVTGQEKLAALDAATGAERWHTGGIENTPAVDEGGVYASVTCGWNFGFNRADGTSRWSTQPTCSGSGGSTPVVHRGRLYVPENSTVYDAASGAVLGTYAGGTPMFAGDIGVFDTPDGRMRGVDLDDGRELWTARVMPKDARPYLGGRIISGSTIYALAPGRLDAIDLRTGVRVWSGAVPEYHTADMATVVGAAPGLLLVLANGQLTAWENMFDPEPREIEFGPKAAEVLSRERVAVGGIVGADLRGAATATLEFDAAPYGRWRRLTTARIQPDGYVGFRVRVDRNTRLRVRVGRRTSNVGTLYAYPKVGFKIGRAGATRVRTTATIRHPRGIRMAGRRAVVYLGRFHSKRFQRLGSATLSGGGGTARAVVVHGIPTGITDEDFVAVCVVGQAKLGLGRNAGLTRACGRRSVRF
jgi:outer membrane protein assembly factor BamB